MYDRPCAQYQPMVIQQHSYYPANDLQLYYSLAEHQEDVHTEDEIPSETSGDQSPNTDMFSLAFVASQSSKLVLNAEELFNKIMSPKTLLTSETNTIKKEIEHWLCMKQEYEECIAADDSESLPEYYESTRRSLERIEEVTETDEKTDESNHRSIQKRNINCSDSESEMSDEEEKTDTEFEHADFLNKLDECMKKFKHDTDIIIDLKNNDFHKLKNFSSIPKEVSDDNLAPTTKPMLIKNQFSRRTSILPYSEISEELLTFQKQNSNEYTNSTNIYNKNLLLKLDVDKKVEKQDSEKEPQAIVKVQDATTDPQKINILEVLKIDLRKKESQLKKIQTSLDITSKQMGELKNMIKVKEQFIEDMLQRYKTRSNAKEEFQKKRSKYKEKYENAKRMLELSKLTRDREDESICNEKVKEYQDLILHYEKRIKDTNIIKQFACDSVKTIKYIESLLTVSKVQMEELQSQFQKEENSKKSLENEIVASQQKIKDLEEKQDVTNLEIKKNTVYGENERYQFDLNKYEENQPNLDYLFDKKQMQQMNISDKKERLRQNIINLREVRDILIDRKYAFLSGQIIITPENQRELSFIGEYIEVIDAIIEEKNVMICDNAFHRKTVLNQLRDLTELSYVELIMLFDKYFYKVIDLQDSAKNLELHNNALIETFMKQRESELKLIKHQKVYERNIDYFMLNHCTEENNSFSYNNEIDRDNDFENLLKENQILKQQLVNFKALEKNPESTTVITSKAVQNTNNVLDHELLHVTSKHKTKVIRGKNKLIITKKKQKY